MTTLIFIAARIDGVCRFAILVLAAAAAGAGAASAQTAGYQLRDGQQFGYEIKGEADRGTRADKFSGTIVYTVKTASAEKITLDWRSNVHVQESGQAGGGPRSPFAATSFSGTHNGTLQITPRGEVVSTKDAAHLPYLLGDAALLMIEALPEAGRSTWRVEGSVTLSESGQRQPGPPRGSQDATKQKSTASESAVYRVGRQAGGELAVEKQFELKTVELINGKPRLEFSGQSTWIFDTERQLPQRLELKQTLVARSQDRTSVEIPITLKCEPLADEEIQRLEAQRDERIAAAQKKLADKKAKRIQPLDEEARKALLADLQSGNPIKMQLALQRLAKRPAAKDDRVLADAIKALLTHPKMEVRHAAADAWAKYSEP